MRDYSTLVPDVAAAGRQVEVAAAALQPTFGSGLADGQGGPAGPDGGSTLCQALGFSPDRVWSRLDAGVIAGPGVEGVPLVPLGEALGVLWAVQFAVDHALVPAGVPGDRWELLDFFPSSIEVLGRSGRGEVWEFRYALAVELARLEAPVRLPGAGDPLAVGVQVLGGLGADGLGYARLWVAHAEADLLAAHLRDAHDEELRTARLRLAQAYAHREHRVGSRLRHGRW